MISFNKDKNRKDGLYPQSKICREMYYNLNQKRLYDNKNILMTKIEKKEQYISEQQKKLVIIFHLIVNTTN